MKNDCVEAVLSELERFGLKGVVGDRGKHLEIRWQYSDGRERFQIVPSTPSDNRGALNARGDVRRRLREDGVQPPPAEVIQFNRALNLPKPEDFGVVRLAKLEKDFETLLDITVELNCQLSTLQERLSNAKVSISFDIPSAPTLPAVAPVEAAKLVTTKQHGGRRKDKILKVLAPGGWVETAEIIRLTGLRQKDVYSGLAYMKKIGELEGDGRGNYRVVPKCALEKTG